jgi:MFS family permease
MSVGIMVSAVFAARVLNRIGIRVPLIVGPALALGGLLWLTQLTPSSGYPMVIGPLVMIALGMGQCFVPLTVTAIAGVRPEEAGLASALLNTGQQIGGALGLSVLGTVAISSARHYARSAVASGHHATGQALVAAATTHGYTSAFTVAAALMLISLVVIRVPKTEAVGALPDEALAGIG